MYLFIVSLVRIGLILVNKMNGWVLCCNVIKSIILIMVINVICKGCDGMDVYYCEDIIV